MDEEEDFFRPPAKSPIPAAVIVSVITTVAVFFVLRFFDERGILSGVAKNVTPTVPEVLEVPSLLGMRPEQARELLHGRDLLLSFSTERDSTQYPAGTIAEQTPLHGSQVRRGRTIEAVLSRGSRQAPVPKVAGLRTDDAVKEIVKAGLSVGPQKAAPSETAPLGTVVETEPPAGTPLDPQGAVTLIVASGPAEKPIPKVTGIRLRTARDLLEQQGFQIGKIRRESDDARASGVVLDQKPVAATTAPPGTPVDLIVNED